MTTPTASTCPCGDAARDNTAPMILCDNCSVWYHFDCIRLSESDADDIASFVCSDCHTSSGLRTTYTWEGEDALEEVLAPPSSSTAVAVRDAKGDQTTEDEDKGDDSDEYVEQKDAVPAAKRRRIGSRQNGRSSQVIESDATSDEEIDLKPRRPPKRKASTVTKPAPSKRARSQSTRDRDATDDPTRKYCTGKLLEVLEPIFNDYHDWKDKTTPPKNRELSPEEKERARQAAANFVQDLEHELFEHYSEPDKLGHPAASGKYKERFRMITFNLAKEDRVILRRRIAFAELTPSELAQMSSTELANEQTKQAIEHALKESLEHSILESRITAPRAKMTHKGMEMVEDLMFAPMQAPTEFPPERPRVLTNIKRESLASMTDITPTSASATEPQTPALPTPHIGGGKVKPAAFVTSPTQRAASSASYFMPSVPDATADGDDEGAGEAKNEAAGTTMQRPGYDDGLKKTDASTTLASLATPTPSTSGADLMQLVSPTSARRTSFNLGSLWTDGDNPTQSPTAFASSLPSASGVDPNLTSFNMDMDMDDPFGEAALQDGAAFNDDRDFDMFLEEDPVKSAPDPLAGLTAEQIAQASYESLPVVFSGECIMPDMVSCTVQARQVGGRELIPGGAAWTHLFTSQKLRIDGRVPVPIGSKYLVDSRLNPGRELVAVALSPVTPQDEGAFESLVDLLSKKERYGVSFPWGNPPSPQAPGKELYILPLLPHAALPESIELLDNVRVPQPRTRSTLLGVFVLHKGRVVDTPAPAPSAVPATVPPHAAPTPLPPSVLAHLPTLGHSTYTPPPPVPMVPGFPLHQPAAAASAVSALTPEQISLMLRSLSHLTGAAPPGAQTPAGPAPVPPPPVAAYHPPPPGPFSAYAPHAPPPLQVQQHPIPLPPPVTLSQHRPSPPLGPGGLPVPLGYPEPDPHAPSHRGGRGFGHRGGGGRGGGRGGGGGPDRRDSGDRPRDAGWRGRGRGRPAPLA